MELLLIIQWLHPLTYNIFLPPPHPKEGEKKREPGRGKKKRKKGAPRYSLVVNQVGIRSKRSRVRIQRHAKCGCFLTAARPEI